MHRSHLRGEVEEDREAGITVKILIVWSGALVPAYRQFFLELARFMRVRALGPRRWTHGSVPLGSASDDLAGGAPGGGASGCELVPAAFRTAGGSRYLVPSLPLHLWRFRPRYLYLMEEMDRATMLLHALLAKLAWPPVKVVSYCLQNLPRPAYHRWHHALFHRLNNLVVDRAVAASREAAETLASHGWRGPTEIIPLWGSESIFSPGEPGEAAAARRALGIPEGEVALLFAGSLVEAKGLRLLLEVLPRFPRIHLAVAGRGPLEDGLARGLGGRFQSLGPLEGEALVRFYRGGDYVILPSVTTPAWKEQIGRSLIEGVLCGAVALGSDSGHIPELTLFAETSFRQNDPKSLAALLGRLPLAGAERIRAAQRRNVMERFAAAAVARKTWEFLGGARETAGASDQRVLGAAPAGGGP